MTTARGLARTMLLPVAAASLWMVAPVLSDGSSRSSGDGSTDSTDSTDSSTTSSGGRGSADTIRVHVDDVVTEVPVEMNGGGCGIEFIEHEIYGGLSSQLVVGESFEEPFNATTGISVQWAIGGGGGARTGHTHRLLANSSGRRALNGLQFLQMQQPQPAAVVWAQNRGLNMQGLTFSKGLHVEGWLWMAASSGNTPTSDPRPVTATAAEVSVQLRCGSNRTFASSSPLAVQKFTMDVDAGGWKMLNVSELTPTIDCIGDGSIVIALHTPGVALDVDMVFLQPGPAARYKGLPVRKDLAEFLLASGMTGMRMGGGTINAWICTPAGVPSQPGSGYVLANFRGPRWKRQPLCGQEYPYTSAGWGWVEFLNFCEAANLTAALTLNELDDPEAVVEYLFGSSLTTAGGRLRSQDGHPLPYDMKRMMLEVGNERMPGKGCAGEDCVGAFFNFTLRAQKRATELELGRLPLVLAIFPGWGSGSAQFNPDNAIQKAIVQRAYKAGLDLRWDQHVNGMAVNDPYLRLHGSIANFPQSFFEMGKVTAIWQATANGTTSSTGAAGIPTGVRTVVFEENGTPGWTQGLNIHNLARGLGHAQNVLAFQRVPGPHGRSQVVFVGQADCLQAYKQNHGPGCDPKTDKRHCNSWDQGTVFFDNRGNVWGQPNYYAAQMLAQSHQPLILNVTVHYNGSFPSTRAPPAITNASLKSFYAVGSSGGAAETETALWLRHCDLVLFGTPVPSKYWRRNPATDRRDSTFYVRACPTEVQQPQNQTDRFWLSPVALPAGSLAAMPGDGNQSKFRLRVVPTAADCASGQNVFERLPAPPAEAARTDSFKLRSISPGATHGLLLTLINDGCSPGLGKPRSCNFSAAGDTCRAAVLAPASSNARNLLETGAVQDWHVAPPNSHSVSPPSPLPPTSPAFRIPVALDAHASKSADGRQLSVRVVNPTNLTVSAAISMDGMMSGTGSSSSSLHRFQVVKGLVLTSSSRLDDNSPSTPQRVAPKPFFVSLLPNGRTTMPVDFPPISFVVVTFQLAA
eukprot:SAG31_NODE_2410_length_5752_cov_3.904803_3_plen_1028_part_00